jgi:hypothetical protein
MTIMAFVVRLLLNIFLLLMALQAHAAEDDWRELVRAANNNPRRFFVDSEKALGQAEKNQDKAARLKHLRLRNLIHEYVGEPFNNTEAEEGAALARELGSREALCEFLDKKPSSLRTSITTRELHCFAR